MKLLFARLVVVAILLVAAEDSFAFGWRNRCRSYSTPCCVSYCTPVVKYEEPKPASIKSAGKHQFFSTQTHLYYFDEVQKRLYRLEGNSWVKVDLPQ